MTAVEPHSPGAELVQTGGNDLVVSEAALTRVRRGRADATTRSYAGHWARFVDWCAGQNRTALPATAHTFLEYANHLMDEDKSPKTITCAAVAIRDYHRKAGHPAPEMDAVKQALVSYGRDRAVDGKGRKKKAKSLTLEDVGQMIALCDPDTAVGVRDRAILVLGVAMMGRRSEIASLTIGDVRPDPNGLVVYVAASKTDQSGEGREVPIAYWARAEACPVRLVTKWIELLSERGHSSGPLFRRIDRHGRMSGEDLFAGRSGEKPEIDGEAVDYILKRRAQAAGLPALPEISAHSLRRGGATIARQLGADSLDITRVGGWVDGSKTALGYMDTVDRWKNNPFSGVRL